MAQGLFSSPEDIAIMQQMQNRQTADPRAAVRGSLFNAGNSVGNAGIRGVGGDSRSPLELRAGRVQEIAKGIDFKDPNSIMEGINSMNQGGFQAEAFKLMSLVPKTKKPDETVGPMQERLMTVTDDSGNQTTKKVWGQVSDTTGKWHSAENVTSSGDSSALGSSKELSMNRDWTNSPVFRTEDSSLIEAQLLNNPIFKGLMDTEEGVKPLLGRVRNLAGQLKRKHHNELTDAVRSGKITRQFAEQQIPLNSAQYLNLAYQRYVESGGIEADVNTGFGVAGGDVSPNSFIDTSDLPTTDAKILRRRKKNDAITETAARTSSLVVGDPKTDEFRLSKLDPRQAAQVFSRLDNKSDEQIIQELSSQGFTFNDKLIETHAQRWQIMRENPVAVAKFLSNADDPDLQGAEATLYLNELDANDNFHGFEQASAIFAYLSRVSSGTSSANTRKQKRIR